MPYVASWNGNVDNENWKVRKILEIGKQIHAYIQQKEMRQTVDGVCRGSSGQTESLFIQLSEKR